MYAALIAMLAMASPAPVAAAEQKPIRDADKIVCKSNKETRSRITSAKICLTKAEWDEQSRADQEMMGDISEKTRLRY